jgi:hypothetical protein
LFSSYLSVHHKRLYVQLLLHFNREFLKTLHECLLPYGESHIAFWFDILFHELLPLSSKLSLFISSMSFDFIKIRSFYFIKSRSFGCRIFHQNSWRWQWWSSICFILRKKWLPSKIFFIHYSLGIHITIYQPHFYSFVFLLFC